MPAQSCTEPQIKMSRPDRTRLSAKILFGKFFVSPLKLLLFQFKNWRRDLGTKHRYIVESGGALELTDLVERVSFQLSLNSNSCILLIRILMWADTDPSVKYIDQYRVRVGSGERSLTNRRPIFITVTLWLIRLGLSWSPDHYHLFPFRSTSTSTGTSTGTRLNAI